MKPWSPISDDSPPGPLSATAPCPGPVAVGALAVAVISSAAALGFVALTLIDALVLLGVAVVLPLALPRGWHWLLAATGAFAALLLPTGPLAAAMVLPWIGVAAAAVVAAVATASDRRELAPIASAVAASYALVAAFALACSRLGAAPFAIQEPIVELTAVHFTYVGGGALMLATCFLGPTTRRWRTVARVATVVIAGAPVLVATGFVTHRSLPQVGGAVLLSIGVWLVATLELRAAGDPHRPWSTRALFLVSGTAIWIPMVLAIAWAAGQHWEVPALSIDAMAHTHGVLNALAFIACGLVAARSRRPPGRSARLVREGCVRAAHLTAQ